MPLTTFQRRTNYQRQNGCSVLTDQQWRRLNKKAKRWLNKDQSKFVS